MLCGEGCTFHPRNKRGAKLSAAMSAAKRQLFIVPDGVVLVVANGTSLGPVSIALSLSAYEVRSDSSRIDPTGPVRPLTG